MTARPPFTTARGSLDSSRSPSQRLVDTADLLGKILDSAGLKAALIGGHAVNFWERPRFTDDFDFTVAADGSAVAAVVSALLASGFRITRNQAEKAPSGPDFVQLKNAETGDVVEFQTAKTEYQNLVIERAVKIEPSQPFAVATREDLIVLKLIANRPVDQQDVLRLGRFAGLDWDYVAEWAAIWSVTDKLARLRELLAEGEANEAAQS